MALADDTCPPTAPIAATDVGRAPDGTPPPTARRDAWHVHHALFSPEFIGELVDLMWALPPDATSKNMLAQRHFLRDSALASRIFSHLPTGVREALNVRGCCSDLRFIRYPPGGYIAPHTDGVRCDEESGARTSTSFLLYLATVPEGEGGETTFLSCLPEECAVDEEPEVLGSVRPTAGSILLFAHGVAHRGEAVGVHPKLLLRGDLY